MDNYTPYPYQIQVGTHLLKGKNIILQAPTGAGKTRAAIMPFLSAFSKDITFPRKCIYSVPMRVLANQFVKEYKSVTKKAGREDRISVAIQTGEQPEDREFRSNLIFATIDQTLSSFLNAPYSLPRRKANLNAGALVGAYLVFDEFHLFEPSSTLPTTLAMLKMLKGISPFILMTATFSQTMLQELGSKLDAVVVPTNEEELQGLIQIPSQQKTRRYHVAQNPLDANRVLEAHQGKKRSLVICNTVDRARLLFDDIRQKKNPTTEVFLLHARFLREDRNRTEEWIRELFGKDARNKDGYYIDQGDYIVVATQAIEVGVDISAEVLHTELAPANAIIQRAGRCARYEGDQGDVYIYSRTHDAKTGEEIDLREHTEPYLDKQEKPLFASTLEQFQRYSGQTLDFRVEQEILSAVHNQNDDKVIEMLKTQSVRHFSAMSEVMKGTEGYKASSLIREVFSQQVTIHANPDELLASPLDVPSFSLHPGTIQGYLKDYWLEPPDSYDLEWHIKYLWQGENPDIEDTAQDSISYDPQQKKKWIYRWEKCENSKTAMGAALLVIHPALVAYDKEQGFLPYRPPESDWQSDWSNHLSQLFALPEKLENRTERRYTYRLETYTEHIRRVYEAFEWLWTEVERIAAHRLEERFGWEKGSVRKAAELAVLLHDVGKLSQGWQGWVQKYQKAIKMDVQKGEAYAHTELQTDEHRDAARKIGKRPWHAVEGAIASIPFVEHYFPRSGGEPHPLATAIYTAIARHHAPYSSDCQDFSLISNSLEKIVGVSSMLPNLSDFPGRQKPITHTYGQKLSSIWIAQPETAENNGSYLAYLFIVRLLRKADQVGTEKATGNFYD